MPEGVEVKLSGELIKPLVVGKKIINVIAGKNSRYSSENPEGYANFLDKLSESTTIIEDVDVKGAEGKYSSCFKVYGKKKDPLGNKIVKEDSGGRSIHWCPTIQV